MTALLDVNVLVALAWPNHIHHKRAHAWFAAVRGRGWATCPLTQSGFVRVSSNTAAIPDARAPREASALLRRIVQLPGHVFWPDDVSVAEDTHGVFAKLVGYRQVTDAHLLSLAIRRGGCLATFDAAIRDLAPPDADAAAIVELIP